MGKLPSIKKTFVYNIYVYVFVVFCSVGFFYMRSVYKDKSRSIFLAESVIICLCGPPLLIYEFYRNMIQVLEEPTVDLFMSFGLAATRSQIRKLIGARGA